MFAKSKKPVRVMAFYHSNGLTAAWHQAKEFAGKNGHLATMPEIVAARLGSKPGDYPWKAYFTTLTAEYFGLSRRGCPILIVAHGIGPMSTLDGIQKAYSWEYKDSKRSKRGGRITQEEFLKLESGKYGKVEIVDYKSYCTRYKYPFIEVLKSNDAMHDPVLKARLGPLANEYVIAHAGYARAWHFKQANINPENTYNLPSHDQYLIKRRTEHLKQAQRNSNPYIIEVGGAANCCYGFNHDHRPIEEGYAIAHLISTGGLCQLHHEGKESLVLDIDCHEWWNGVRLVGIQTGGNTKYGIHPGPDSTKLIYTHWRDLFQDAEKTEIGLRALVKIGNQWFTQYPKIGERMDTGEPEYKVTSIRKIDKPVLFRTTASGSGVFFKFGINEVQAITPPKANAYFFIGDPKNESGSSNPIFQTCKIQFYRIRADTSKRLIRSEKLSHDMKKMMLLLAKDK